MAEVLFILTTIFVAYVVFVVVECEKRKKEESAQKARSAAAKAEPTISAAAAAARTATSRPARPAASRPAPARAPAPAAKPQAPAAAEETSSDMIKNPKTGEVVKVTSNYRFTKRWIKEALVSEGLLDKIYKNNEIDDAATAKINAAIEQLKAMKKYH